MNSMVKAFGTDGRIATIEWSIPSYHIVIIKVFIIKIEKPIFITY